MCPEPLTVKTQTKIKSHYTFTQMLSHFQHQSHELSRSEANLHHYNNQQIKTKKR